MALNAGSIEIKLFADIARLQKDMNKANKTVDAAMNNIEKSVNVAKKALANIVGVVTIGQIVKLADEYKRFDSQLKLATRSVEQYGQAYNKVVQIARASQSDIGAIGVLYARLANNLREFGTTQKEIGTITESIALSLRVSNATVQETSSVMLQLSQSFGSGKLNGQEFLAVAEGAPIILRQLAKSMGVPYGALKDLSAQGQLTAKELSKALSDPQFLASLQAQAKEVGTISSAVTVLMNNLKQFVGETDKANGTSRLFAQGIILLADNINLLATVAIGGAIVAGAKWIATKTALIQATIAENAANKAKAASDLAAANALLFHRNQQLQATIATNAGSLALSNNAMASTLAARATASVTAAQAALTTATAAASRGMIAFRSVLGFLGGPIGAIITTLGLAATAFISFGKTGTTELDQIKRIAKELNEELEKTPALLAKKSVNSLEELAKERARLERELEVAQKSAFGYFDFGEMRFITAQEKVAKIQELLNASLIRYNELIVQKVDAEAKANVVTNKALEAEKFLRDEKIKILSEEIAYQEKIIQSAKDSNLSLKDKNDIIEKAKKAINDLTGATKALKDAEKQGRKDEKERAKEILELVKIQEEFLNAQAKAREGQIESIDKSNESLQEEINKVNESIEVLRLGEDMYQRMELARMNDAIATAKQIVEQGKLNGLTGDALAYAEEYITALERQVVLKEQLYDAKKTEAVMKEQEKAQKEEVKAAEKAAKEIEEINDRTSTRFSRSLTDAIFRGFEEGKSFAENFKDSLINSFKTLVLQPIIKFIIDSSGLNAVLGAVQNALGGGTTAAGQVASGGGGIFSALKTGYEIFSNGLDASNLAFQESIASFGNWVSNLSSSSATGFGGAIFDLGQTISNSSELISKALPYAGSVLKLVQGDIKGAAFTAAGTAIGSLLGGPIGGAIGSFLGGALGGLFGGKDQPPRSGSFAKSSLMGGKMDSAFGNTGRNFGFTFNIPTKDEGIGSALQGSLDLFSFAISSLNKAFGGSGDVSSRAMYFGRPGGSSYKRFAFQIDGEDVFDTKAFKGKDAFGSNDFNKFISDIIGKYLVTAINKLSLAEGVKNLFKGLTDKTEIVGMIDAVGKLARAEEALTKAFGLNADTAAKVAIASTNSTEELTNFVAQLSEFALSTRSVGTTILDIKKRLGDALQALGFVLPQTTADFDALLRGINKNTQDGIELFSDLFALRGDFATFTNAIKEVKGSVDGAIFSLLSPTQQLTKLQDEMAKVFNAVNLAVPKSAQELLRLANSIDYTTEEGLNLASMFPTLVDVFQKTRTATDELVGSFNELDINRFRTLVDFQRARAYAQNGIDLSNIPSYAVGTNFVPNDGLAMIHKGEKIIPASENRNDNNELIVEVRQLRQENTEMKDYLRKLETTAKNTETILRRVSLDGNSILVSQV